MLEFLHKIYDSKASWYLVETASSADLIHIASGLP